MVDEDKFTRVSGEKLNLERINELQKRGNEIKVNPWVWNDELSNWNFILWKNLIDSLLDEVWSRLNETERRFCKIEREIVGLMILRFPIYINKAGISAHKKKIVCIEKNKIIIKKVIFKYDNFVRDYIEKYYAPLTQPSGGDESGVYD